MHNQKGKKKKKESVNYLVNRGWGFCLFIFYRNHRKGAQLASIQEMKLSLREYYNITHHFTEHIKTTIKPRANKMEMEMQQAAVDMTKNQKKMKH